MSSASFVTPEFCAFFFPLPATMGRLYLGNIALIMSIYHLLYRKFTVVLSSSQLILILISKLFILKLQWAP